MESPQARGLGMESGEKLENEAQNVPYKKCKSQITPQFVLQNTAKNTTQNTNENIGKNSGNHSI